MASLIQQPVINYFQYNVGRGEDRYLISDNIYGVFDGHGGSTVSETISTTICSILESKFSSIDISSNENISQAIISAFNQADENALSKIKYNVRCGSTCSLLIKFNRKLVLVNLGDSDIILFVNGEKYCEMPKHLYSNPEEKARIDTLIKSGGIYTQQAYSPKVINSTDITMEISNYVGGESSREQIVPTKNFGHLSWKKQGKMDVIPYIKFIDMLEDNSYECIIATDGILDMLVDSKELQHFCNLTNQSKKLVEFADARWKQQWRYIMKGYDIIEGQKMTDIDDMTAIYIRF